MPTCQKCKALFRNHVVINGEKHNLSSRKFCLDCSPFGRHNTINFCENPTPDKGRVCPRCNQRKEIAKFYTRRQKAGSSPYCKQCTNEQAMERQWTFKQQCVDYKGGKCEICDYSRCIEALEFHHLDAIGKDFSISAKKMNKFDDSIKAELDKCQLCCANCHREIHAKQKKKYSRQDSNLRPIA